MFGYPGGQSLQLYDDLIDSNIRYVLVRHEQCAAHMADGFAHATGKVGVCTSISGPGATNLVTGVATAYVDSSLMMVLTGQVPTTALGNQEFQEADSFSIIMPITKHNLRILDHSEIKDVLRAGYSSDVPYLIDIRLDPEEDVLPMVPPGDGPGHNHAGKMHMEPIMITGERSPGLIQRVIIELGRRGIESEKMFMIHEGDKTKIIIEADICKMNGRLLHALMGPQDVELAEHLHDDSDCFWKCSPNNTSGSLISKGNDNASGIQKLAEEYICKYKECEN